MKISKILAISTIFALSVNTAMADNFDLHGLEAELTNMIEIEENERVEAIGKWKDILNPVFGREIPDPEWDAEMDNPAYGKKDFPNPDYDPDKVGSEVFILDPSIPEKIANSIPQENVLEFPEALEFIDSDRTTSLREAIENTEDDLDDEKKTRFAADFLLGNLIESVEKDMIGTWKKIRNPDFGKMMLDPTWQAEVANPDYTGELDFPNPDYDANEPGDTPPLIVDPNIPELIPNPIAQGNVLEFPQAPKFIDREETLRAAVENLDNDTTTGTLNVNEANIGAGGLAVNAKDGGIIILNSTDGDLISSSAISPTMNSQLVTDGVALSANVLTADSNTRFVTDGITASVSQQTLTSNQSLVINKAGNEHGLRVGTTSTSLSGGNTASTTMRLDDNGVTFGRDDGAGNPGAPVQLHGIANGTAPNDAVNYSQLQNFNKRLSGGIAAVTALTMVPDPALGHRFSLGIGYGNYDGESAAAFGFTGRVTNNLSLKAGIGFSNSGTDRVVSGVGVGYSW